MNIITAKEAQNITNKYFPYAYEGLVSYLMEKIEFRAKSGTNGLELYAEDFEEKEWKALHENWFQKFMYNLGYFFLISGERITIIW